MGLASSIFSGVKGKQAADAARRKEQEDKALVDKNNAQQEAWFNKQYYQDFTQRNEVQDILRQLGEENKKQDARDDAQAAIIGATPEQQLSAQEGRRKSFSDAVAGVARNASILRDSYLQQRMGQQDNYMRNMLGLGNVEAGINTSLAANWATAGGNAFNAGAQQFGGGIDSILAKNKGVTPGTKTE